MTLLGFKERFVPNVEAGYADHTGLTTECEPKRHSIRAVPKDGRIRFKVGHPVQLYRRVRQSDARKIIDVDPMCTKIEPVLIAMEDDGRGRVLIQRDDGSWNEQEPHEIAALAHADGFGSPAAFFDFFTKPGDYFRGHIIHWDWQ